MKQNRGVPRSRYLVEAMRVLRDPLRQDLAIPWDKIRELGALRALKGMGRGASPGPSATRRLKRVQPVAFLSPGEKVGKEKPAKRRKVEKNEMKKKVEIRDKDHGKDVRVKTEETHFEVMVIFH
jgi:hypothetical protein